MSEKFEKAANDYDKPTLVHAVALMLNLHDMMGEANKLSKPALWRIFDNFKETGTNYANLEDRCRDAERKVLQLQSELESAKRKVATMEGKRNGSRTKSHK